VLSSTWVTVLPLEAVAVIGVVAAGLTKPAAEVEIRVEDTVGVFKPLLQTEEFAEASTQITAPVGTLVMTVWNSVAEAADPVQPPLANTSNPLSELYRAPGWVWQYVVELRQPWSLKAV